MNYELQKKIDRALKLIASAEKQAKKASQPLEICYSGGKDSDVILQLAKMAGVEFRAIYKNTTIDAPGTIQHVLKNGVEIVRPKKDFRTLMAQKGWPSRKMRFCCVTLKEYKILDYAVVGVRRDESWKRAKLYNEPEICRVYNNKTKVRQYLPILDWNLNDVTEFLHDNNIKCAPVYYDEYGRFCPERRLGCICCPLKSRRGRIEEFKQYPRMVKMYLNAARIYRQTHKRYLDDEYQWFVCYLFCESLQEFHERFGGNLFEPPTDCKKFLEDYFEIDL